jgi:hypothetical protein
LKGYALGSGGSIEPLSISSWGIWKTSGAIDLRVPAFNVWREYLVLEVFVLDHPKPASFAFRQGSLSVLQCRGSRKRCH